MKLNNLIQVRYFILIISFVITNISLQGQERVGYNLYNHYQPLINPASMSSYDQLTAVVLWNYQMAGFTGAPMVGILDINSPIGKSNVNLGGQIAVDRIGNRWQNFAYLNFSYRVQLNLKNYLGFGISAGLQNINWNYQEFVNGGIEPNQQTINQFAPDFKLGAYYFADRLYIGFATNNLIKLRLNEPVIQVNINDIQFMLHGGYKIRINDLWSLTPSMLFKQIAGSPLQIDVNLNAMYNQIFGFGLSYRTLETFLVQLNVKIAKQWFLGYGYNMGLGFRDNKFYHGHEVMLMFNGLNGKKKLPVSCPRF